MHDEPGWEVHHPLNHRQVKHGHKMKVEYLLQICATRGNITGEDYEQLVQDYCSSKPEAEHLVVMLLPLTHAHARQSEVISLLYMLYTPNYTPTTGHWPSVQLYFLFTLSMIHNTRRLFML